MIRFTEFFGPKIKVRVLIHGRIGDGWRKVDEVLRLPSGSTLAELVKRADLLGLDLSGAIEQSPHLRHTLMLNGERLPLSENLDHEMKDDDQVFEDNGVKVVVDKKSFLYLVGTELRYSGGLNGKGFEFHNPNANRTCGCGESFSL